MNALLFSFLVLDINIWITHHCIIQLYKKKVKVQRTYLTIMMWWNGLGVLAILYSIIEILKT